MKLSLIILTLLILGFFACNNAIKKNPKNSTSPFVDKSVEEARKIAFSRLDSSKSASHQFVAVIVDENANKETAAYDMGFQSKDKKAWDKNYISVILKANEPDAQRLIEQYYIQAFPVTIKEELALRSEQVHTTIQYGAMPQVSGNTSIDIQSIAQQLKQQYLSGDKDQRLLLQLRDHIEYLEMDQEANRTLHYDLTDDYLQQFSKAELSTYAGYKILKKELKNTRYKLVQNIFSDRSYYNKVFIALAEENGSKKSNQYDADWILKQAVIWSLKEAAIHADQKLYKSAIQLKSKLGSNQYTETEAKAILKYQLTQGNASEIKNAALQYFSLTHYSQYGQQDDLVEGGANAINQIAHKQEEWQLAEHWMDQLNKKSANPTRLRLQAELLKKLDRDDQLVAVLAKMETYQEQFSAFKNLYPIQERPISLHQENIRKGQYKDVDGIPSEYRIFYRYISKEGSIYKKGEKLEPIALLSDNSNEVELLSRVHLSTGSILPLTHIRSYYIRSRFNKDGEHLDSKYVTTSSI